MEPQYIFPEDRNVYTLAIDTETTGLQPLRGDRPFVVTVQDNTGDQWIWEWPVDLKTRKPKVKRTDLADIRTLFDEAEVMVFHHAKFDIAMLEAVGISFRRWWPRVRCTLLLSHLFCSTKPHGLKELARMHLGIPADDEDALLHGIDDSLRLARRMGHVVPKGPEAKERAYWLPKALDPNSTLLEEYALCDVFRTIGLWVFYNTVPKRVPDLEQLYRRELDLIPVLMGMERHGAHLRKKPLHKSLNRLRTETDKRHDAFQALALKHGIPNINPASPKQVAELIYGKLKYLDYADKTPKTKDGQYSTKADYLKALANVRDYEGKESPGLQELLDYRKMAKGLSSLQGYAERAIERKGELYLHTSYNQTGTGTTRLSSSKENLQNVSDKAEVNIRDNFGPPTGMVWVGIDYSQLELRILAYMSGEPLLLRAYVNGEDVHQQTADLCEIPRKLAKAVNFTIVYGGGKELLYKLTGIRNMAELFFNAYPDIGTFFRNNTQEARSYGFVYTAFGYRLFVPSERPYAATDYKVQGTAGDVVKYAMVQLHKWLKKQKLLQSVRVILNVHDELILEIDKDTYSKDLVTDIVNVMMRPARDLVDMYLPANAVLIRRDWAHKQPLSVEYDQTVT